MKDEYKDDQNNQKRGYLKHVDGLRALAVLPVVVYHADLTVSWSKKEKSQLVQGGFLGVDAFFVISGFLITGLLQEEFDATGTISILSFYERRLRRIGPALVTVLAVSTLLAILVLDPSQQMDYAKSLVASLFSCSNLYWWLSMAEYEAESSQLQPLLHTWSLACEEQYYLLFPVGIMVMMRYGGKLATTLALILLGVLSFFLANHWDQHDPMRSFYTLPSRFWELALGGTLALSPRNKALRKSNATQAILSYTGLFLIVFSFLFQPLGRYHPGVMTLPAIVGSSLLIIFGDGSNIPGRILCSQLLVSLGRVSYSIYLWHVPLFAFGRRWLGLLASGDKIAAIALALILSYVTHSMVETPFRNRQHTSTKMSLGFVAGVALLLLSWSGFVVLNNQRDSIHEFGGNSLLPEVHSKATSPEVNFMSWLDWNDRSITEWQRIDQIPHFTTNENQEIFLPKLPSRVKPHTQRSGGGDMFSSDHTTFKVLIVGDSFSLNLFNSLYANRELYDKHRIEFARFGVGAGQNKLSSITDSGKDHDKLRNLRDLENDFRVADAIVLTWRWKMLSQLYQPLLFVCRLFQYVTDKTIIVTGKRPEFFIHEEGENDRSTDLYWNYLKANNYSAEGMNRFFYVNADFFIRENDLLKSHAENCSLKFADWRPVVCEALYKECLGLTPDGSPTYHTDGAHWSVGGFQAFGLKIYTTDWMDLRRMSASATVIQNN